MTTSPKPAAPAPPSNPASTTMRDLCLFMAAAHDAIAHDDSLIETLTDDMVHVGQTIAMRTRAFPTLYSLHFHHAYRSMTREPSDAAIASSYREMAQHV